MAQWLGKLLARQSPAGGFFVSPSGSSSNTGAQGSPWDLQTAMNGGNPGGTVQPGHTLWLRGGTYTGKFDCQLQGTAGNRITLRNYPGEHVVIDRANGPDTDPTIGMFVPCQYVTIIGTAYPGGGSIEITNSSTDRTASYPYRDTGVRAYGPGIQIINCVIHDHGMGISTQSTDSTDFIAYGNLIYYNGNQGNGHGIYPQSFAAPKTYTDNMLMFNAGRGLHAFSGSQIGNRVAGNIAFGNGTLTGSGGTQYLFSGATLTDTVFNENYGYGVSSFDDCEFGDSAVSAPFTMQNNFLVMNMSSYWGTGLTVTGNTVYPLTGAVWLHNGANDKSFYTTNYATNTWATLTEPASGKNIFVRPNAYEVGRGHVYIFNWDLSTSVSVDLSTILTVGVNYEIRYGLNYYGTAVATGNYGGGSVSIPVNALTEATPVGLSAPTSLAPKIVPLVVITL